MLLRGGLLLLLLVLLLVVPWDARAVVVPAREIRDRLNRSGFPDGFIFGAGSSAYQYEGAAAEGCRGPSIWDTFTHNHPEKILDGSNGNVAIDFYHHYKEDVNIMKKMGLDAFRFSISWSRILPNGSLSGGINKEGVKFYNKLIDELISNGLKPFVTLFHWDVPQGLEDKYGGFLSPLIVDDFLDYAEICFKKFGDRVKYWATLNEPYIFTSMGYASGTLPPGRCSPWEFGKCSSGDSATEPYIVAHHQLLTHAATVKLYKDKFKVSQKGEIGISLATTWITPLSHSKSNTDAAERALDFSYGWFMDPLTQGDYPFIMRALVGDRLPKFTKKQSKMLKGSFDFIGLNYYTTNYAYNVPISNIVNISYTTDSFTSLTGVRRGTPIGPPLLTNNPNPWNLAAGLCLSKQSRVSPVSTKQAGSFWLYVYPPGIRDLLLYTKTKYNNPVIYITENGVDELNNGTLSLEEALKDDARVEYHREHLLNLQRAIRDGVDVRGYLTWSLLDDFEWGSGYTIRFGMYYVDYKDGLKRYPKTSARWFREFLKK